MKKKHSRQSSFFNENTTPNRCSALVHDRDHKTKIYTIRCFRYGIYLRTLHCTLLRYPHSIPTARCHRIQEIGLNTTMCLGSNGSTPLVCRHDCGRPSVFEAVTVGELPVRDISQTAQVPHIRFIESTTTCEGHYHHAFKNRASNVLSHSRSEH